jgi:hypothetical protein
MILRLLLRLQLNPIEYGFVKILPETGIIILINKQKVIFHCSLIKVIKNL